ncbi:GDP-mannose 4,6-dehydratase [Flavobacteriaceae bacterium]|nr:GDP-mannose 4,6-dehydratase [Flavobacteriaceae bacterium]
MKILITGCCGFIGSSLTEELLSRGHYIIGLDNFDKFYSKQIKLQNIKNSLQYRNFQFIEGDVGNTSILLEKKTSIDVIIHLAASPGVRNSFENTAHCLYNNINETEKLLNFSFNNNIKKFIFASSSSVYGVNKNLPWNENEKLIPISPYAFSKLSCETLGQMYSTIYDIKVIALRFFTVYGPKQRPDLAIFKFFDRIVKNKIIQVYGKGDTFRDYTYIDDIVEGIINSIEINSNFEIINLGNNRPTRLLELLNSIERITNKRAKIEYLPLPKGDVPATYADIKKAKTLINFSPKTKLESGLNEFYDWYKSSR